jgi:tRNA-dihydrouridine synthase B
MPIIDFSKKDLVALAPLAGYTDLPFRTLAKEFGADLTFSEMISSNALIYHSSKTYKMLEKSPQEFPYIVQIAGSDIEVIKNALKILNTIEGIDGIDLNCGCPVPKIVSQNAGSSLLQDLDHLSKIVETIKKYSNKNYTSVKSRLGFNEKIAPDIAKACEKAGADFVTFHGRTRAGKYKAPIDYTPIKEAKEAVDIPIIANGDITSLEIAKYVRDYTKCDGIMIGRGAVGNPWIFYQIKNNLKEVSKDKIKEIVLRHYDLMVEFYGQKGVGIFRKHIHNYSKGLPNASEFRDSVNRVDDIEVVRAMIGEFFSYPNL